WRGGRGGVPPAGGRNRVPCWASPRPAAQPASGFGLICSLNTLGCASTPPSPWKLVRVPDVVHRPLPCQPPFGSSMRPSAFLVKKPIGYGTRNVTNLPSTIAVSDSPPLGEPCAFTSSPVSP